MTETPAKTGAGRSRLILGIIAAVLLVAAGVSLWKKNTQARVREVTGTITRIDLSTRTAALEIVHPKNGQRIEISGAVPPDCDIRINDKPAGLGDLKVGEVVRVQGLIGPNTLTPNWVRATRDVAAASQSAVSAPASAP